jgi:uncharacterized membrane protein
MRREIADMVIGLVLIVVGIIIMLFVFSMAMNLAFSAGDYFREQFPEEEVVEGPSAEFSWNTADLDVTFQDDSIEGDGNIVSWEWDFGDGSGDDVQDPDHQYAANGSYQVRLRIEDENGKRSSARGDVQVQTGEPFQGFSETDSNGSGFDADFGDVIMPIAAAILVGILFIVMFAVGAAITKAGWNILKPKPEKLKIKLKPKEMEIKQVGTYAAAPPEAVQYEEQMPPEQYSPPPPEDYQQEP